jgi:hypothetical protein
VIDYISLTLNIAAFLFCGLLAVFFYENEAPISFAVMMVLVIGNLACILNNIGKVFRKPPKNKV